MWEQNMRKLDRALAGIVMVLAGLILVFLLEESLFFTSVMVDNEKIYVPRDSPLPHLFVFACLAAVAAMWNRKKPNIPVWVDFAAVGAMALGLVLFIHGSRLEPINDQEEIFSCAQAIMEGDLSCLMEGGYICRFSNQKGFLLYVLAFWKWLGEDCIVVMQYMNVGFFAVAVLAWYAACREWLGHRCMLAQIAFVPAALYVTFLYGTIPGLGLCCLAFWCLCRWQRGTHPLWAVGAGLFMALACQMKSNYLIGMVALCLFLGWDAIDKRRWQSLAALALTVLLAWGAGKAVDWALYGRNGLEVPESNPAIDWVAMGLQENENKSGVGGWWNGYNDMNDGRSRAQQTEDAFKEVERRLTELSADPLHGLRFFSKKNVTQWDLPTYESLNVNHSRYPEGHINSLIVSFLRQGSTLNKLYRQYCNLLQTQIWIGALLFLILRRRRLRLSQLLPMVMLVGGFWFHTAWEAKGQYTMPYVFLLMPCALEGFLALGEDICALWESRRKKQLLLHSTGMRLMLLVALVPLLTGLTGWHFCQSGAEADEQTALYQQAMVKKEPAVGEWDYTLSCMGYSAVLDLTDHYTVKLTEGTEGEPFRFSYPQYNYIGNTQEYWIQAWLKGNQWLCAASADDLTAETHGWIVYHDSTDKWTVTPVEGGYTLSIEMWTPEGDIVYGLTAHPETGEVLLEPLTGAENQIWHLERQE